MTGMPGFVGQGLVQMRGHGKQCLAQKQSIPDDLWAWKQGGGEWNLEQMHCSGDPELETVHSVGGGEQDLTGMQSSVEHDHVRIHGCEEQYQILMPGSGQNDVVAQVHGKRWVPGFELMEL